jgi:Mce-associated membrane protein
MPDRPKNRPRIAGQRRTAADRRPEDTPLEEPTTVDAPAGDAPQAVAEAAEEVTPATVREPEKYVSADSDATPVTERDSSEGAPALGSRINFVLTVALSVLIVIVLALAGVLGVKAWRGQQAEQARGDAAAAGRKAAETALSYDYRSLDKSFADARATMTPDFAAKFDETAKVAGELATKTKATVRAEVREVGVRDGDANRVTLVIFVNQTTTSTITQGKPRVDLNRTRFTMVRNGDRWLVQEIAGL